MKSLPLGEISLEVFLDQYWQKKPLLIRNALPDIMSPVSPDELAGLACESNIESRLIINDQDNWQVKHGPLEETVFENLPKTNWTLLVQAVDHHVPGAAELLARFDFIPRWRIDDLMVSYAPKGGGVGPHFDNYDVFLVQTLGQRLWQVGGHNNDNSSLIEDLPVKILQHFEAEYSWILNPGDILYLPPGVGHNGIAQSNDCMTCSIGFYTPSHSEVLREYCDFVASQLSESERYQDPDLLPQDNTGEISNTALEIIHSIITQHLYDTDTLKHWFGRYITTPKYQQLNDLENSPSEDMYSLSELEHLLSANACLHRNESSRFAYQANQLQHNLFVDGKLIQTDAHDNELIELLCKQSTICATNFSQCDSNLNLLLELLNRGALYITE